MNGQFPELLARVPIFKQFRTVNIPQAIGFKEYRQDFDDMRRLHKDRCLACGSTGLEETIDGKTKTKKGIYAGLLPHPVFEVDVEKYRFTFDRVAPLCEVCWKFSNLRLLKEWYDTGLTTDEEFTMIVNTAYKTMKRAGIDKNTEFERQASWEVDWLLPKKFNKKEWQRWHLKIGKKKIYSPYKNLKAYNKVHCHPLLTVEKRLRRKDSYIKMILQV